MLDLGTTFLQTVERSPNATALVDGTLRLSYTQWYQRISQVARGLSTAGLKPGDHVLAIMQNRWEMATLHWACQFNGLIMTPLNWRAKADEIVYCAHDADARLVVIDGSAAAAYAQARTLGMPSLPLVQASQTGETRLEPDALVYTDWLAQTAPPAQPQAAAQDWSLMLYTSGTTGKPKGVPRRHAAERAAALAHVAQNRYASGECTLGVMPLYHTMGVRSLLAQTLLDGCLVCVPKFDTATCLQLIETEQVTHLYLVPTLYHDLLSNPAFANTQVGSVRKLGFAGAPMADALLQRLNAAFRPELFVNHYGSSEIFTFSVNQRALDKPGCAGRAGVNSRLRLVRLDAKTADDLAATGEEGQIIADLKSDEAFSGYWKRPDADTKSLRDGWYFTGDTGVIDGDGDLFVTGRVDDMIISGGENISPVDIESVISLHPAVDEVAVAGLFDERWGQKVVAFVKAHGPVDATTLDAHCRDSDLMSFKRPREYVFVRDIPKSPVGKILRRKLVAGEYDKT